MPNYKRARVPGGSYFFSVVTYGRRPFLTDVPARPLLGSVIRRCRLRWPFSINALVLLPDHLHAIWTLPPGDDAYSRRWGWIKKQFTNDLLALGGNDATVSCGKRRQRRHGVWQPRFWEHTLGSEKDFERHFDYVHYNPVKHGLAECPRDWPWSTFHRWVWAGVYPKNRACWEDARQLDFSDISNTAGE